MRPSDGAPVFNDHSDPDYDAGILGRMPGLHRDTLAWLEAVAPQEYCFRLPQAPGNSLQQAASRRNPLSRLPEKSIPITISGLNCEYLVRLAGMTRAEAEGHPEDQLTGAVANVASN